MWSEGEVGLFQSVDTAVVTPWGITPLYCGARWEAWLGSQASQQWSLSSCAGSFSPTAETGNDPASQAPPTAPVLLAT